MLARVGITTPFTVRPVNTYLLIGDAPTLIDTGPRTKEAWETLVSGLAGYGLAPRDLRQGFIIHSRPYHYGKGTILRTMRWIPQWFARVAG
jgi:hypothetical protein